MEDKRPRLQEVEMFEMLTPKEIKRYQWLICQMWFRGYILSQKQRQWYRRMQAIMNSGKR